MRMNILFLLLALIACKEPSVQQQPARATPAAEAGLDYLMGKFDPAKHPDFVRVDPPYSDREGLYMRREAFEAFSTMRQAASGEGISLRIISAARSFDYQKGIWERKWTGERLVDGQNLSQTMPDPAERAAKIMQYSAMPGASRHHWGTDIDINDLEPGYFESGKGKKEYDWLAAHAGEYGFCQVYCQKGDKRPTGYNEEAWHWSYLPLSQAFTAEAARVMKDTDIQGFKGAEAAVPLGVVKNYVLGINPECL